MKPRKVDNRGARARRAAPWEIPALEDCAVHASGNVVIISFGGGIFFGNDYRSTGEALAVARHIAERMLLAPWPRNHRGPIRAIYSRAATMYGYRVPRGTKTALEKFAKRAAARAHRPGKKL